ncbi:MAG TPA: hypothetical protein VM820_02275 [Vicinamibacterales bacterium]|nr:hypothetical protein [Vicinamibacterales bacterium]
MPPVQLLVVRIEQRPGRCGAASAQMMLHFKGRIGASLADQDVLWAEIQQNTTGARPSSNVRTHECPAWATMQCDRCPGEAEYTCWCSFPDALTKTLVDRQMPVSSATQAAPADTTALALASVDFNMPAAVLAKAGMHWTVVNGYLEVPAAQGVPVGGRSISDVFVRNPAVGAANQSIEINEWLDFELLPVIICGPFRNQLVCICATAQTPAPAASPTGGTVKRRQVPKKPPKRRRPKKPPKPPKPPQPGPKRSRRKRRA